MPGGTWHSVNINGTVTTYDPAVYDAIYIDALGGEDRMTINGTTADETAALNINDVHMASSTYDVYGTSVERTYVYASTGNDSATLAGSANVDKFYGRETYSTLYADDYYHYANGFDNVSATAGAGSVDYAYLYDTSGDDSVAMTPTSGVMTLSTGATNSASGFGGGYYATATTGVDTATMLGSAVSDTFNGKELTSYLTGAGYYQRASGFDTVTTTAVVGGTDRAYFYDTAGDDAIALTPTSAAMTPSTGQANTAIRIRSLFRTGHHI